MPTRPCTSNFKPFAHYFSGVDSFAHALSHGGIENYMPSFYYDRSIEAMPPFVNLIIDSGAYTFIKDGIKNFEQYHLAYKNYIVQSPWRKKAIWVEIDVDEHSNVSLEQVMESRKDLESTGAYIMPVWHPSRGIENYRRTVREYPYIGFPVNAGIGVPHMQYLVNLAYKNQCLVHGFGLGSNIWKKVPFYSGDSSTWIKSTAYGIVHDSTGKRYRRTQVGKCKNYRVLLADKNVEVFNGKMSKREHAHWNIDRYLDFENQIRELWLKKGINFPWVGKSLTLTNLSKRNGTTKPTTKNFKKS